MLPLQIPEPSADGIAQLTEMGFSEALARKALLLCRNNTDAALEWVLQHMEDEDAEAPPTEDELRQVGSRAAHMVLTCSSSHGLHTRCPM